jgi:hypothetical protein
MSDLVSQIADRQADFTVADRARIAAEYIDHIVDAANGARGAALQLKTAMLVTETDYNMIYVLDWVERRRGADTADLLRGLTKEVLSAVNEMPRPIDLFSKGRQLAWKLRGWANDIEAEDNQREEAGKQEHGKPAPPHPFDTLLAIAKSKLKGNELRVVELICEGGGACKLADLAADRQFTWNQDEIASRYNGTQRRLKPKLRKHGWDIYRENNEAKARIIPSYTRQKSAN